MSTITLPDVSDDSRATEAAVRAVADAVPGTYLPGTADYQRLTGTFNLTRPVMPLAVVEARDARDVATTLRLAGAFGIRVGVQSTGHGAGESMAGTILVSTAALTELEVHPAGRWARVGAGVKWEAVLEAAAPHGLGGLCGSSPDVGVVGFLTGGGLGPLARTYGLSADSVRSFDVVTGDGELRRASAVENPDLFWGLRGGKGTLGIVTAVEIDLVEQPTVYGGQVWFDLADASAVLRTWAVWCTLLPEAGTTSVAVMRLPDMPMVPEPLRDRAAICLRYAWTADPSEGEELLAAMRSAATPFLDTVQVLPYAALGAIHTDPVEPVPVHEDHALLGGFDLAAADRLVELVGPQARTAQLMVEVRQLGGAVREERGAPAAFPHRHAAFSVFTVGIQIPETAEIVAPDARRVLDGLTPWAIAGGLPNFTAGAGPEWADRVFSPEGARRLRELSLRYDPDGTLLVARGVRA
ncbi:FAD-binding oxidoreductase [Cellulomonas alba]|uniref:FAD-binding oxidoreductase n=1 Tax=Cellulomonas alba TaxID=3053467 RepID=A0ABT7SE85_9CELL|nr:FAD-binding oxidoreductase [Cellulomonas alba]MDM7854495.1 FAD-binding oxidoreductase [Cellulomonas alba]